MVAVRGYGEGRRAELYRILDFCDDRLDALQPSPHIQIARQSVAALRHGLNAPAQAAATNLVDQLLWAALNTVHGKYGHSLTRQRVANLTQATRVNALVAVTLAVSLPCQWHDSHWRGLRTLDEL